MFYIKEDALNKRDKLTELPVSVGFFKDLMKLLAYKLSYANLSSDC